MPYVPPNIRPAYTASPGVKTENAHSVATRLLPLSQSTDSFEKLRSNTRAIHIQTRRLSPQIPCLQKHRSRRRSAGWQLTKREPLTCKGSSKQHSELVIQLTKKSLALSAILLRQEVYPLRPKATRPKGSSNMSLLPHAASLPRRPKPKNTQVALEHPEHEASEGSIQKAAPPLPQSKDDLQTIQPQPSEAQDDGKWISQRPLLQKELERLYFWSSNFSDEELETILGEQTDLKNSILESLSSIGQILIDALRPGLDIDPRLHQPVRDLDDLVKECKSLRVESYDEDGTASETSDISTASASDGEKSRSLLDKLRTHIDRLQGHVRVMRRVLDFTESHNSVEEATLSPKRVRFQLSEDARPPSSHDEKRGHSESSINSFLQSNSPAIEYYRETARSRQQDEKIVPRTKSTNSLESIRLPFGHVVPAVHDGLSKRKRSAPPSSGRPCIQCSEKEKLCDGEESCTPCKIACVRCIREARDLALCQSPDSHPLTKESRPVSLDRVKITFFQEIWDRLGTLPRLTKLAIDAGNRIMIRVSTNPGSLRALDLKPQVDSPGSDPRPNSLAVDALDMLCKDLDAKLRDDDIGLPTDVTSKFLSLVPELSPSLSNRDSRRNKNLERSPLLRFLHPITSILVLIECLPDWTVHTQVNDLSLAGTILSFVYGCFVKQLLAVSDKLSKEIFTRMMNKVGHNEEVRYAIGTYYCCVEHLSRLEAGIKLNEMWDDLQPNLRNLLSILSCLFDETRDTLRSKKTFGPPTSILRMPKEKHIWSDNQRTSDMLDPEMDLSTFIIEFVPEIPVLPPFHLVYCLSNEGRSKRSVEAPDPSKPLSKLKALSARHLLTEVTSNAEITTEEVVNPALEAVACDELSRVRPSTPHINQLVNLKDEPPEIHRQRVFFKDESPKPLPAESVHLLANVTREVIMHSPVPPQPPSAEDIPDDIADLEDRDNVDLTAIQRSSLNMAMNRL